MKNKMKNKLIGWIVGKIFGKLTSTHSCSNRFERTYRKTIHGEPFEYKIVRRQLSVPDAYSREERYQMAQILRREFARDGWDVFACFDSPTSLE